MDFYVDKSSDLMRSTFTAVGLAQLLYRIPPSGSGQQVTIRDMGSCYHINSTDSFETLREHITRKPRLPALLPAISKPLTSKEQKLLEQGTPKEELTLKYVPRQFNGASVNYGDERKIAQAAMKYKPPKDGTIHENAPPAADPNYPVWAHLCSYFGKGSAMRVGYPTVIHSWYAHENEHAVALWELICDCYETFPNVTDTLRLQWENEILPHLDYPDYVLTSDISAFAIVSPSTSKGISAQAGYNKLTEDTPTAFWLEMYLAFAGYMQIAMPFNLDKDVMTYYPIPRDITVTELGDVVAQYRDSAQMRRLYRFSNTTTRARLDVLTTIRFYQQMIRRQMDLADELESPMGWSPEAITGMVGYYYKNIATQIPFDETVFALPAWLPTDTLDGDALAHADQILEAHFRLIDRMYKVTADEIAIIAHYRRYLTHGDGWDWVQFTIAYGHYRFRILPEIPSFPMLTVDLFKESLPMNTHYDDRVDFTEILDDPGFRNITAAINHCTVYSRYKKDVQRDKQFGFKVRHGLGDDLRRNAHDPALFINDLSDFIHSYQAESSSVRARHNQSRTAIQPDDIQHILALVSKYGSRTVAHLLVAVGYAAHFDNSNAS